MQKSGIKKLVIILSFLLVSSCASVKRSSDPVWIDKFSSFALQPVPEELSGRSMMQKLTITSTKGNHELLIQTELLSKQINMVGFSVSGLVLFQLHWQAPSQVIVETKIDIEGVDAAVLLAYFQMSNWPVKEVAFGLKGMEARVSPKNDKVRHFFRNQELIFSLTKNSDITLLEHYRDKYRIEIETLETSMISTN